MLVKATHGCIFLRLLHHGRGSIPESGVYFCGPMHHNRGHSTKMGAYFCGHNTSIVVASQCWRMLLRLNALPQRRLTDEGIYFCGQYTTFANAARCWLYTYAAPCATIVDTAQYTPAAPTPPRWLHPDVRCILLQPYAPPRRMHPGRDCDLGG